MGRKKRKKGETPIVEVARQPVAPKKRPTASYMVMNNSKPVPIAPPADFIQLTPIVQPMPIVPYSTQKQPLFQFDEDEDIF